MTNLIRQVGDVMASGVCPHCGKVLDYPEEEKTKLQLLWEQSRYTDDYITVRTDCSGCHKTVTLEYNKPK